MRLLIDECVDPRVKDLFPNHVVSTVHELGWNKLQDKELLARAQLSFDVLVTLDRGLEFQHNLKKLKMGIIVAKVPRNQLRHYQTIQSQLQEAV
jgi:predicted nuclease of predicted toxin-antitoxin system